MLSLFVNEETSLLLLPIAVWRQTDNTMLKISIFHTFSPIPKVAQAMHYTDLGSLTKEAPNYISLMCHKTTMQHDVHQNNLKLVLDCEAVNRRKQQRKQKKKTYK